MRFLVLYGTDDLKDTARKIAVGNLKNYEEICTEKIIEENKAYQREIKECREKFKKKKEYGDIEPELIRDCNIIYHSFRADADRLASEKMREAIEAKLDILFYLRGDNIEWFVQHDIPLIQNYDVEIIYVAVDSDKLTKRAMNRAKKSGRMPDRETIYQCAKNAEENFLQLINHNNFAIKIIDNDGIKPREIFSKSKSGIICNLQKADLHFLPGLRKFATAECEKKTGSGEGCPDVWKKQLLIAVLIILIIFDLYFSFGKSFANFLNKSRN